MSLVKSITPAVKPRVIKEKYILGTSECYLEPSAGFANTPASKFKTMILNEAKADNVECILQETAGNGKGLKLTLTINHEIDGVMVPEVQHVGLVIASDFSMELDSSHVEQIKQHVRDEPIVKRTAASDVLALF